MILLGIISNGISSLVIGSARLKLQGVNSAPTTLPGDGMLMDGDDIVLLLGKEEDVATITRGKFILEYDPWVRWRSSNERKHFVRRDGNLEHNSDAGKSQSNSCPEQGATSSELDEEPIKDEYTAVGLCSLLLVIQLLAQLLLIPQGTLFGQILFLSSFAASWGYNLYLSSIDDEHIQKHLILERLHLKKNHMRTYVFGTRTTAAVFTCLTLQPADKFTHEYAVAEKWQSLGFHPEDIIRTFIPNNTPVWITWRKNVLEVMRHRESRETCHGLLKMSSEDGKDLEAADKRLLVKLLKDTGTAYDLAMEQQQWLKEI